MTAQHIAIVVYVLLLAAMVTTVLVATVRDHRKRGNEAYRARTMAILDKTLPREDELARWRANREDQRQ